MPSERRWLVASGLGSLMVLALVGCVPRDGVALDPREIGSARPAAPEVAGRRASARLEPVARQSMRGTVFFRETARDLAIEAVIASIDPGEYHLAVRTSADCKPWMEVRRPRSPSEAPLEVEPVTDLGAFGVGEDGAGRLALATTTLALEPGGGLVGRAVTLAAVATPDQPVACGVVEPER